MTIKINAFGLFTHSLMMNWTRNWTELFKLMVLRKIDVVVVVVEEGSNKLGDYLMNEVDNFSFFFVHFYLI